MNRKHQQIFKLTITTTYINSKVFLPSIKTKKGGMKSIIFTKVEGKQRIKAKSSLRVGASKKIRFPIGAMLENRPYSVLYGAFNISECDKIIKIRKTKNATKKNRKKSQSKKYKSSTKKGS